MNLHASDLIRLHYSLLVKRARDESSLPTIRDYWQMGETHFQKLLENVPQDHPDEIESFRVAAESMQACRERKERVIEEIEAAKAK